MLDGMKACDYQLSTEPTAAKQTTAEHASAEAAPEVTDTPAAKKVQSHAKKAHIKKRF